MSRYCLFLSNIGWKIPWTYGVAGGERNRAANILLDEMKSAGVHLEQTLLYFTSVGKKVMPSVEYATTSQ